jgi:hypothetical protein
MTAAPGGAPPPQDDDMNPTGLSQEELRAAYEAELAKVRVDDVLVQTVVSLLNLAARKAGLTGAQEEPDFEQVGQAIEATLSQLQLAYARAGTPSAGAASGASDAQPGDTEPTTGAGPAQSSGRLWVPGQ